MRLSGLALALAAPVLLSACDGWQQDGSATADAPAPPLELTGRVVDAADVLDPEFEATIAARLERIEQDTLAQMVVVTTPDLGGLDIADYSRTLGNGWGIGDAERNDGLLLVVAPIERRVRIEVGRGLEGTVTDGEASRIIEQDILPHFEENDMPGGIGAGVEALEDELREEGEFQEAA